MTTRVRFAPSPTGLLHIGSARTALFNYIFAKATNGKFLLRIEDTDKERSTQKSVDAIFDGMKWLGLENDEDVVFQSTRYERHLDLAKKLIESGHAYYAYDTKEELDLEREIAQSNGKSYRYSGKWRNSSETPPKGISPVIRIKIPNNPISFQDLIKGDMNFPSDALDDFIIIRSDNTPTYMFAVVVDDIDMKITHIIRGDDHLSNTPKQIAIYNALGANLPHFAHLPLIHDEGGGKMSKRKNAVAVSDYANMGILPEALKRYLLSLGWSFDENLNDSEIVNVFKINDINQSPARFDIKKLYSINSDYIQKLTNSEFIEIVNTLRISNNISELTDAQIEVLEKIVPELRKCNSTLSLYNNSIKYTEENIEIEDVAMQKINENKDITTKIKDFIMNLDSFDDFDTKWKAFLAENGLKFPQAGPILRGMLIGTLDSTSIGTIISTLPKEVIKQRIEKINN